MAASNNAENKSSIQLITFDSKQKIDFCCSCKITINTIAKKLTVVVPQTQDSQKIEASFDQNFIIENNILCVVSTENNIEFALVFKNNEVAKKVFDVINKTKNFNDFETHEQENNDEIFDHKFLFPLFDSLSSSKTEIVSIQMVHDFIDSSINRKKERYIKVLKERNIYNIIFPEMTSLGRKRKVNNSSSESIQNKKIKQEISNIDEICCSSENENNSDAEDEDGNHKNEEKPIIIEVEKDYFDDLEMNENDSDYEYYEGEESENDLSDLEEEPKEANVSQTKIVRLPDFEFHKNRNGDPKGQIIIFDKDDRNLCYKYCKQHKEFLCYPCYRKKKICKAKIIKDKGEECVLIKDFDHLCGLRPYKPEKKKVQIKVPDFELRTNTRGVPKSTLLIILLENKDLCYRFYLHHDQYVCYDCNRNQKRTTAKLYQDKDGADYIETYPDSHICAPRPYKPIKPGVIIKKPKFEFQSNRNGVPKSKLIIFANDSENLCYCYGRRDNLWHCDACLKMEKSNTAKIFYDENEEECILLENLNHVCNGQIYKPEKKKQILKPADFEIRSNNYGVPESVLIIFYPANRNLCYRFVLSQKHFACRDCYYTGKKRTTAKLLTDDKKGEKYVEIKEDDHICHPRPYEPVNNNRIIEKPNFEWQSFRGSESKCKLIVFSSIKKDLCYEYFKQDKRWYCSACLKNGLSVMAKIIQNDENEECMEIVNENHVCEPVSYTPEEKYKIIKAPNFELRPNKFGVPDRGLIIFASEDKSLCYYLVTIKSRYVCLQCSQKKSYISAKIMEDENGEKYVKVKDIEHVCKPQKYKPYEKLSDVEKEIIEPPNYELRTNANGIPDSQLIVYDGKNKNLCHNFCLQKGKNLFICSKCKGAKQAHAKIVKNDDGSEHIEIKSNDHLCKPGKYRPPNVFTIIKSSDFVTKNNDKGVPNANLIVYANSKKTSHYKFYLKRKEYICLSCANLKKTTSASLLKDDENGEDFIQLRSIPFLKK